jgi:uncharacterized protein YkwD
MSVNPAVGRAPPTEGNTMRSSITKRLALIAMIPATLLAMVAVASPAQAAVDLTKLQGDVAYLTNKQRALHGCKALKTDARLTNASRAHSAFMARSGSFSHVGSGGSTFDVRIKKANYPAPAAENIAFGYRTGVDVVKAWMASPGHRANILNCQEKTVGVGAVVAASGAIYVTQDFGY